MVTSDLLHKKIGVWGYGISGRSLVKFLLARNVELVVFDQRELNQDDQDFLMSNSIVYDYQEPLEFLNACDYVIPSPGIDLRKYAALASRFIAELDLFQHFFTHPIIAITGTLGKTTITTLLVQALRLSGKEVVVGGNIGVGLFDLIGQSCDVAVLEVSSFQLELCTTFAPDVALWTNFYPNHLDRHGSMERYREAKEKIFIHQKNRCLIGGMDWVFTGDYTIPEHGFKENWKLVIALLEQQGLSASEIERIVSVLGNQEGTLEHRLEKVSVVNGVEFINDSKATVPEASLAAVNLYNKKNMILLLGGLSKGVDRKYLVSQLLDVKKIICFGQESDKLLALCDEFGVNSQACATLDKAFFYACEVAQEGDTVLLSPSGSSFDLYKNYLERGEHFKKLVRAKK